MGKLTVRVVTVLGAVAIAVAPAQAAAEPVGTIPIMPTHPDTSVLYQLFVALWSGSAEFGQRIVS